MLGNKELSLSTLRTFVTIVDEGGFTHAAQALGLTQPTVSQQLRKLEQTLGRPVLDRGRRKLDLTPAGQTLIEYARRILMLNDEAIAKITSPNIAGALRLGLPHEFTISILPQLVGAFSQSHPNVVIEVECELSKTLLANLNDYDFVIALHDHSEDRSGIRLRKEPLSWVSALDYRPPNELEDLHVVAAPDPCIYRDTLQRSLQAAGRDWSLRLSSSSYGAVCAAVSTGMGITVLARSVVPENLRIMEGSDLPNLPDIDLRLHYDHTERTEVTRAFATFVTERLSGS